MAEPLSMDQAFIRRLMDIVLANIHNENFGAEDLAKKAGMSRASLYRRLQSLKKGDISQFIREVRLKQAMKMLETNEGTASEIAFRVGFGSSAYFTKCFHEYYGFPPGEVKRKQMAGLDSKVAESPANNSEEGKMKNVFIKSFFRRHPSLVKTLLISSGLLTGILLVWTFYNLGHKSPDQTGSGAIAPLKSIILLPFDNLSKDPDNQYFADGVMEAILNNLYHVKKVRVISKTTSEQFRKTDLTAPEIAEKLNVKYVLEGSVFKSENKVRIFVNLIDAMNDQHLWSESYDRNMQDIFAVQNEIAFQIANSLKAVLTPEEVDMIKKVPTKSIEAYNYYLYGKYFLNKNPQELILKKSIEYFEKSVESDPDFAQAYAGMARATMYLAHYGLIPWKEGRARARELAMKALEIDKTIADAHCILGNLARYEFKWEEAMREFLLAIEYEPDNPTGHDGYSMILFSIGRLDEAREQVNIAKELNPLSLEVLETSVLFYLNEGKIDEMGEELGKMYEIDTGYNHIFRLYCNYYGLKRDTLNAMRSLKKACDTDPVYSKYGTELMNIYNKSGYKAAMEYCLKVEIENKNSFYISVAFAGLNRREEALIWLEKAYEEQHSMIYNVYYAWPFRSLRSEPRFQAIIEKMGLFEYIKAKPAVSD